MAADRLLLFGGSGQVGHALIPALARCGQVTALSRSEADLSHPDSLSAIVTTHKPDVVVIAAAYTAVDRAESEPQLAERINAEAPGVIARAAAAVGACVVYYSTDYVFDGSKTEAYLETDLPAPLSIYGSTKLAGERAVSAECRRHLIFRTSWVFAAQGNNFLNTMLRLASERTSLRVVADQVGAPTSADLIADVTAGVLATMRPADARDSRWGTYHLSAAGATSWHAYARHVLATARQSGMHSQAGPDDVLAIATADYPTPARRPANSRLNTERIRTTFGVDLPHWTIGVDHVLAHLLAS